MTTTTTKAPSRRRALLTAAAAFAVGAAIAAPTRARAIAPTAVDPLPALFAERSRLFAISDFNNDEEAQANCDLIDAAENQMADTVAISGAGLIVQVELLKLYQEDPSEWADQREFRLCDTIIAGIRILTQGGAA